MARITVEDCLTKENNRFALVQLASKRTKQLLSGARPLTPEARGNKAVVSALREIAEGHVRFMTDEDRIRIEELRASAPRRDEQEQHTYGGTNGADTNGRHFIAAEGDEVVEALPEVEEEDVIEEEDDLGDDAEDSDEDDSEGDIDEDDEPGDNDEDDEGEAKSAPDSEEE